MLSQFLGSGNIKAGLEKLRLFQTYSGGFGYWPGNTEPNEWATNYAGHFMIEAEAKGYKLPNGLKENWLKYQKTQELKNLYTHHPDQFMV